MKTILSRIGNVFVCLFFMSVLIVRAENAPIAPPEGTVAVLHVSSLQQLADSVTGFLGSALETKIDLDMEDLIGSPFDLENLNGIDRMKPILAFILDPKEGENEGSLIGFYPVADEKEFLSQFGELKTVKEGIFDTDKLRLASGKGYVAVAKKGEADLLSNWLEQGGDAAALAAQTSPVQGDVWVHVYFEKVADKYKESITEFRQEFIKAAEQGPAAAQNGQRILAYEMDGLIGLLDGVQTLDLGISADAQALQIRKLMHPKENSELAEFVRNHQAQTVDAVKGLVVSDAIVTMLGNFGTPDWLYEFQKVIFSSSPELNEKDRDLIKKCREVLRGSILAQFEIDEDPDHPIVMNSAQAVVDTEQGQLLLEQMLNWLNETIQAGQAGYALQLKGKTGELKGSPILSYEMQPKESDDPEAETPEMNNLFAGKQTIHSVVTHNVMLTSTGDIREVADRLEKLEPDLAWPSAQDMESMLAVRINLFQLLKGAQKATAKSEGINPLAMFKLPAEVDMTGVMLNLKKSDQNLLGTLTIPAKDIRKLESIVTGQMK